MRALPLAALAAVAGVVAVAGCRLEPPDPAASGAPGRDAAVACDCADGRDVAADTPSTLRAEGPPVVAGDTARVTPDVAGRPDPGERGVAVGPSGLAVPVAGVDPGDLVDTFEAARSEGRTHNALDVLAPRGTPVVAAAPGRVLRLFESDRGGLTVYQLGDDGRTVYYYAHLDRYAPGLASGQRVRRGQRLGDVGDSGNAAPGNTHLHFAMWRVADPAAFWDGEPVNPYPALVGR